MENYKFSTLEYKRPDLEARRTQLAQWKDAVKHAESYDALRALLFEMDRAACELSTQYAIAHIRHTLDTRDAFYEAEIHRPLSISPAETWQRMAFHARAFASFCPGSSSAADSVIVWAADRAVAAASCHHASCCSRAALRCSRIRRGIGPLSPHQPHSHISLCRITFGVPQVGQFMESPPHNEVRLLLRSVFCFHYTASAGGSKPPSRASGSPRGYCA